MTLMNRDIRHYQAQFSVDRTVTRNAAKKESGCTQCVRPLQDYSRTLNCYLVADPIDVAVAALFTNLNLQHPNHHFHLFPFVLSASLEIAYNVMAVDSRKKPISKKAMEAKAILVTM